MEVFITLTKYNICQRREEGKPLLLVTTESAYYLPHNSVQCIYEEWDVPINVHR